MTLQCIPACQLFWTQGISLPYKIQVYVCFWRYCLVSSLDSKANKLVEEKSGDGNVLKLIEF